MLSNLPSSQPSNQPNADQPATDPKKQFQCRHIHTSGRRCRSSCLRREPFCYYHHSARPARPHPGRTQSPATGEAQQQDPRHITFTLPLIEDRASIQLALYQVLNRIANNQIDCKRAGLLLYGLQIAAINLPREPNPDSDPASAEQAEVAFLEELLNDPLYGPIAPIAEVPLHVPTTPQPSFMASLMQRYFDETPNLAIRPEPTPEDPHTEYLASLNPPTQPTLQSPTPDEVHPQPTEQPTDQPTEQPTDPTTIPTIQAVAEQPNPPTHRVAHPFQHHRKGWVIERHLNRLTTSA